MSGFSFRRRQPGGPEKDADAPAADQGEDLTREPAASTVEHIAAYASRDIDAGPEAASESVTASPPPTDAGLGSRIDAIVAAAEQAAEQIRRDAEADAARIRDEAASARADADRTIAEADERARGVREAADSYAATKQREAEEAAGATVARAEERARSIESEAARRRQKVAEQAQKDERKLAQIVDMCRGLADDLEALGRLLQESVPASTSNTGAGDGGAGRDSNRRTVPSQTPVPHQTPIGRSTQTPI